jgi:hypothetical protein
MANASTSRALPPTLALLTALALLGCPLEEPAGHHNDGYLVALFPDNGAAAVPLEASLIVEIGPDVETPIDLAATLQRDGGAPMDLTCAATDDPLLMTCTADEALQENAQYLLSVELDGAPATRLESRFSTAHPEGGGYELAENLIVERFGAGVIASPLLSATIAGGFPLLLVSEDVFDDADLPAVGTNFVWGPGKNLEGQGADVYAVARSVGYPLASVTMIDEQGSIFGSSEHSYLPIWLDGDWHPVRVDDLVMRGTLTPESPGLPVTELSVEANVPQISVDRITAQLGGPEANLLGAMVQMDEDTDLDGVPDAARLILRTRAEPVVIQAP